MGWRIGWISPEAHVKAIEEAERFGRRAQVIAFHRRDERLHERIAELESELEAARAMNSDAVVRELAKMLRGGDGGV